MKIDRNKKIELVVSDDPTRFVLHNVWLDVEKKTLTATDGVMMARISVDDVTNDTTGPVTPKALKIARKHKSINVLECNGDLKIPIEGITLKRPPLDSFPNTDAIIPKERKEITIKLDPARLLAICKALGTEHATLHIPMNEDGTVNHGVTFRITGNDDDIALLMPVRIV